MVWSDTAPSFQLIAHQYQVECESSVPDLLTNLKRAGTGTRKKSRLIAQNYQNQGATGIPMKTPTVKRFHQRPIIYLAPSFHDMKIYTRDVEQAYVQRSTTLERPVFTNAPKELNLPEDMVLRVIKPFYGIPESGLHWYRTYLDHQLNALHMERVTVDGRPVCIISKN